MNSPAPNPEIPGSVGRIELRRRVRDDILSGAVTPDYPLDRELAVNLLNGALATEIVCVLRYRRHHFMARGLESEPIAAEFMAHANEELSHADLISRRIVQLGGEPDWSPSLLAQRAHAEYIAGGDLSGMVRENLIAERIAIETYRDLIHFFGERDPTTRRMLEGILATEEEHADELSDLLQ
jgi:bacterioferritin